MESSSGIERKYFSCEIKCIKGITFLSEDFAYTKATKTRLLIRCLEETSQSLLRPQLSCTWKSISHTIIGSDVKFGDAKPTPEILRTSALLHNPNFLTTLTSSFDQKSSQLQGETKVWTVGYDSVCCERSRRRGKWAGAKETPT